jgi:hypothetical protein
MLVRYLIRQARGNDQDSPDPRLSRREARNQRRNPGDYPQFQQQPGYGNSYATADPNLGQQYDASGNAYPPTNYEQPQRSTWEVWGPRLRLLGAVFLPVILETLDYTSAIYI